MASGATRRRRRPAVNSATSGTKATRKACPTTATEGEIEGKVDALSDAVVTNTTVSPNVPDDAFMAITHPAGGEPGNEVSYEGDTLVPQCQDSSAFTFFAKRGSVNKLLMYYYGGGACWDTADLRRFETCTQTANPTPPGLGGSGFADLTNPDNPFKDWHIIQVPYCSCDIHLGDNAVDYTTASGPFSGEARRAPRLRQRQAGREVGAGALPEPDRHVRHRFERGLLRRDGARRPPERGLCGHEHQRDGRRRATAWPPRSSWTPTSTTGAPWRICRTSPGSAACPPRRCRSRSSSRPPRATTLGRTGPTTRPPSTAAGAARPASTT